MWDVEGAVDYLYRRAGQDVRWPNGPIALAMGLGLAVHRISCSGMPGHARLTHSGIEVHTKAPLSRLSFAIAHEIAEWYLGMTRYTDGDAERYADGIAGAILAPRQAFRYAVEAIGHNWAQLSNMFLADETWALLREAEVSGRPLAVVTPGRIYTRSDAEWVWGNARLLARADTLPDGVSRYVFDGGRRVALFAE